MNHTRGIPDAMIRDEFGVIHVPTATLRDEFAMAALPAIIGKAPLQTDTDTSLLEAQNRAKGIAFGAYSYADAMLAERTQSSNPSGVGSMPINSAGCPTHDADGLPSREELSDWRYKLCHMLHKHGLRDQAIIGWIDREFSVLATFRAEEDVPSALNDLKTENAKLKQQLAEIYRLAELLKRVQDSTK